MPVAAREKPAFAGFIIGPDYESPDVYAALLDDQRRSGTRRFVGFDGRLYFTTFDNDTKIFTELNWREPDKKDKAGRWGKYMFLDDPKRRNGR